MSSAVLVLAACFLVLAQTAGAAQRSDPSANSPAGVIYQIPFDHGRSDAAPVRSSVATRSAAAASRSGSAPGGGAGLSSGAVTPPGVSARNPSSIHSENGFGSSAAVPGIAAGAGLSGAGAETRASSGSPLATYLLLGIIVVAAVAIGFGVARAKRSGRDRP